LYHLLGGIFLGWSLGANDAANVFGTAVSSRMVSFLIAALICSGFVIVGAVTEGQAGFETIARMAPQSLETATLTSVGAGISITLMTLLKIPSSTSQAVVGSLIGVSLFGDQVQLQGLIKVVICWLATPAGGLLFALVLYAALGRLLNRLDLTIYSQDQLMRLCLIFAGAYGAYALGANNVANVTGVYVGAGLLDARAAVLVGGASIALGILTYSKPVMLTVGRKIMRLDAFSALVVVLAEAVTVHVFAVVGVPVSPSQAVVGAVIGVGLVKQASAIRGDLIARILLGWLATPVIAAAVAVLLFFVTHLRFVY